MALNTRSLFRAACPGSGARVLYVAGAGSDSNDGLTAGTPLRQISTAVSRAQPGDRIQVAAGTYLPISLYQVSGSPLAWITIEGPGDDTARIDGANNTTDGASAASVQGGGYIGIYGLEVFGNQGMSPVSISGMAIFRGAHHVRIWACHVHDFPSGGINCFYVQAGSGLPAGGWDLVDLRFNKVHATSRNDPNNSSGISFFGAVDTTGLTWDGTYGYTAVGNYVYDVLCTKPYTAGGLNDVSDGNGISIDSLANPTVYNAGNAPYVKRGLVEGNVIVACGGRGVHGYNSLNWDDQYNLYIGNLRTVSVYISGGIETDSTYDTNPQASGVVHRGNVILPLNTANTTDSIGAWSGNVILGGTQAVPSGNTDKHTVGTGYFPSTFSVADLITGLPLSRFLPIAPDVVARASGSYGYQALGAGPRGTSTSAGALEQAKTNVVV